VTTPYKPPKFTWTEEELDEFDRLSWACSSQRQMERLEARFQLKDFIAKHGHDKCDAMFAVLVERDKKKRGKKCLS